MVFYGAGDSSKRFRVGHLLNKVFLAKMHNDLLDAVFEDFVLATDVEVIQKVLLALCYVILFSHEDVYVLEIFVDV